MKPEDASSGGAEPPTGVEYPPGAAPPRRPGSARSCRFELAGSIQFPVPEETYDELGFAECPIYEPEMQSASIGADGEPPLFLCSDPGCLREHLTERVGIDAVMGMAEVASWIGASYEGRV